MMNDIENSEESKDIWEKIAGWWDDKVQNGDLFHRTFIYPAIISLGRFCDECRILDVACGNGALDRFLADRIKEAKIVAADFSEKLISLAKERSAEYHAIKYVVADATDSSALEELASNEKFDVVICSMAFQDMWTLKPLLGSLRHLLAPNGRFVFSIPHPCFNSGLVKFNLQSGKSKPFIEIYEYLCHRKFEIKAKQDQPLAHIAYHRSFASIFSLLFNEGFVMDGFLEPIVGTGSLPEDFLWGILSNIPPAVISSWIIK